MKRILIAVLAFAIPGSAMAGPVCIWNGSAAKCFPTSLKTGTSTAAGDGATGLGLLNTASGDQSFAGGTLSTASAIRGFAFGDACLANGPNGVATGAATTASGNSSNASGNTTIASGQSANAQNQSTEASGHASHSGGEATHARGAYSFAHGLKADTGSNAGTFALSDDQDFTSTNDSSRQIKMRFDNGLKLVKGGGADNVDGPSMEWKQASVATTTNAPTVLQSIAIATNSAVLIEWTVVGRRTGGAAGAAGDAGAYTLMKRYKNVAGTVTQHSVTIHPLVTAADFISSSEDQASWDAEASTSSPNAVLTVTGETDNNVTWHSTAKVIENK